AYFDIDFALGVNTKALGSTPEPASWDDVVKPDFNGRVVVDSRGYPFGLLGVTWGEQKFTDWMTKLKALQPKLLSGGTNVLQSLASGEAALGIGSFSFKILEAADTKKAPVKISKVSPVGVDLFVSSIPIDVPHPNAARLFAGWIATPEGQASHEKNVGTALLGPGAKSKPAQIYQDYGTQLLFETPENVQDEDKYNKLAQKILGVTA
ncbi:MAG: ABC transporter substrate-binding protein, partial [Chloroflexi bacterium]|nr:ABC transporter substrate-binding protein [Chloroflexota bacterium]